MQAKERKDDLEKIKDENKLSNANDEKPTQSKESKGASREDNALSQILAGLVSGVLVAALFNPWDRALYLSVYRDRPFLHIKNWQNPYKGFDQAIFHRTLSGGLYFPLYEIFHKPITYYLNKNNYNVENDQTTFISSALSGNLAGAVNGILLNNLTTVKYQSWGSNDGFFYTATKMFRIGGISPFLCGLQATILRDMVFGGIYSSMKYTYSMHIYSYFKDNESENLKTFVRGTGSLSSALFATIISSPFNYARNMQYATLIGQEQKSVFFHLKTLRQDMKNDPHPFSFLQRRLRVGWGSLRVAVGMGVGNELYDLAKMYIHIDS